jgi:hypothetical protein
VSIRGRHGLISLVIATAAALAGCSIPFSPSARSTTQDFFKAFSDGNGPEACAKVDRGARAQVLGAMAQGPEQRAAAGRGDCQAFARALSSKRRELFGTVIADPAPGSGGKTVNARFELDPKKPVLPYSVRLHKNSDDWKIVSINSGGPP